MMQGFLFVLTILIWIFLGILAAVLGILFFALFNAIRYRVDGCRRYGELAGCLQVRFLWAGLFRLSWENGKLQCVLRIFGIPAWRSDKGKPPSSSHEFREPDFHEPDFHEPETAGAAPDRKAEMPKEPVTVTSAGSSDVSPQQLSEQERAENRESGGDSEPEQPERKTAFFYRKLCGFAGKVRFSFQQLCDKIKQAQNRFLWLLEKGEEIRDILEDPANQKSAGLLIRQTGKIFRHLLPRKGEGEITFGLEDPYRMGQLLELTAFLYPFTATSLSLHPVFDETVLEGEIHVQGKIRPGILLNHVLRLLLDANIRRWIARLTRNRG